MIRPGCAIAIALALLAGPARASDPGPPPPPKAGNPPILVEVVLPEGGRKRIVLDEAMVRETTGRNIFHDVDAFIEAAMRRLDLDYRVGCTDSGERSVCEIKRIGRWSNSPSHRWVLIRDGYRDEYGINNVNHLGVKTLRFEYQDLR